MSEQKPKKRRKFAFWIFLGILVLLLAALRLMCSSREFCDRYLDGLCPKISEVLGGLMSKIPAPVSEITIAAAAVYCAVLLIMLILLIFLRKKPRYRKITGGMTKLALTVAVLIFGIRESYNAVKVNCSVLGNPQYQKKAYSFETLTAFWNYTTVQLNELCAKAERDENHHLIRRTDDEIREAIGQAAQKLSAEYPRLGIPAPAPKHSLASPYLTSFGLAGYYIEPWRETVFTAKTLNNSSYPSVYAHEYAHYCGYHKEDEANYLALRLCAASDDVNVQYATWLSFFPDIWDAVEKEYFAGREPDSSDPEFLAYCDGLEPYDDYTLILCDLSGNYKRYHNAHGEETPSAEQEKEQEISDSAKEIMQKAGQKHFENTRELLGEHYYDGMTQLLLDWFTGNN